MTRLLSILLIAFLLVPMLVAQDAKVDAKIYNDIKSKLADDPDVKGAAIDVTVTDGAVTLKGRVGDIFAKEKAAKIAKKSKGVKSVDNQLKLFSDN
jgi:osmotically-inducible protein OsmY